VFWNLSDIPPESITAARLVMLLYLIAGIFLSRIT
jgi:hypothetical protein